MGLRCIVYIDDGICASNSMHQCTADTQQIVGDLILAGFVLILSGAKAAGSLAWFPP